LLAAMAMVPAVALMIVGGATTVVRPAKVKRWTAKRGGAYSWC